MNRRSLFGFIILNVLVTFVTVFGIISVWQRLAPPPTRLPLSPPIIQIITTTPDPNQALVKIVTATPVGGAPNLAVATAPESAGTALSDVGIPTLDPSLLPPSIGTVAAESVTTNAPGTDEGTTMTPTVSNIDQNGCQTYTIKSGDIPGNIANTFGVPLNDLMRANDLTEADLTRLQIGQVLTIPINGCGLATEEPSPTPTKFVVPTVQPTVTLAPTASELQLEVVQVISPGDITSEGVEVRNVSGGVIAMQGWTIADTRGKIYTFPEYRMFPGGRVTVYTRAGTNTPIVLYWGQSRPVWEPGSDVILSDAKGAVQSTFTIVGGTGGAGLAATQPADQVPTETPAS